MYTCRHLVVYPSQLYLSIHPEVLTGQLIQATITPHGTLFTHKATSLLFYEQDHCWKRYLRHNEVCCQWCIPDKISATGYLCMLFDVHELLHFCFVFGFCFFSVFIPTAKDHCGVQNSILLLTMVQYR